MGGRSETRGIRVRAVSASVNYVDERGRRGVYEILDNSRSTLALRRETVEIHDARDLPEPASLDREGFTLATAPSAVRDFADPKQILEIYLPELARIVQRLYGASRVWMSPGTVTRITDSSERARRRTPDAARFLHLDYSARSAPEFLEASLGYDADQARRARRVIAVNTWRSLTPAPQNVPLAVCDQRSSTLDDLMVADAQYAAAQGSHTFEISVTRYNPQHRWWFFSNMSPEEILVFKGWDLSPQPTPSVIHGAFEDPACPPGTPERISIEARGFALFSN